MSLLVKVRRENWCLYLLRGMRANAQHFIWPHLPPAIRNSLLNAIDDSIAIIKYRQQERNEK